MDASPSSWNQRGVSSKVRMRCLKAVCVSSETRIPRPMAAFIGVPRIEPDTSTSGTSRPRSTEEGSAAASPRSSSKLEPGAAAARTSAFAASRIFSITSFTPSRIDSHCRCNTAASASDKHSQADTNS
eukprot:5525360-Pleurochrysis_carterae.AAC.1